MELQRNEESKKELVPSKSPKYDIKEVIASLLKEFEGKPIEKVCPSKHRV